MAGSKFSISYGPGTVIGAVAMGDGATASGSVHVGGAKPPALPDRVRVNVDIRNASPTRAATWLRMLADQLDDETAGVYAHKSPSGAAVAWTVAEDKGGE